RLPAPDRGGRGGRRGGRHRPFDRRGRDRARLAAARPLRVDRGSGRRSPGRRADRRAVGPRAPSVPTPREHHRGSGLEARDGAGLRPEGAGADPGGLTGGFMLEFALLVAAVAALLAILDRVANRFIRPVLRPPDRTLGELEAFAYEDVVIPAGAHTLAAWILRPTGEPPPAVFVLAHGWGASYGTLLRLGEPLVRAGHEVVLFDVRGHGRNDELPYVTVRHFRDDVTAVLDWVAGRFPGRPVRSEERRVG